MDSVEHDGGVAVVGIFFGWLAAVRLFWDFPAQRGNCWGLGKLPRRSGVMLFLCSVTITGMTSWDLWREGLHFWRRLIWTAWRGRVRILPMRL